MKHINNSHNRFNRNNYRIRRLSYLLAKDLFNKGQIPIPLLQDGSISNLFSESKSITENIILKWFFKYGFDVGFKIDESLFHMQPKHSENEACGYKTTGFRLCEVKNER